MWSERAGGGAQVKDVIAYLRVVSNLGDVVALRRIINKPTRGLGTKSVDALHSWAESCGKTVPQALFAGCHVRSRPPPAVSMNWERSQVLGMVGVAQAGPLFPAASFGCASKGCRPQASVKWGRGEWLQRLLRSCGCGCGLRAHSPWNPVRAGETIGSASTAAISKGDGHETRTAHGAERLPPDHLRSARRGAHLFYRGDRRSRARCCEGSMLLLFDWNFYRNSEPKMVAKFG